VGTLGRRLLALVSLAAACCDRCSQPSGICGTASHEGLYFFRLDVHGPDKKELQGADGVFFFSVWSPKGCRRHLEVVRAYPRAATAEFADLGFKC
jgi:hypothetical protein